MNEEQTKRPTVVLCPGGGYKRISTRESDPIAYQLLAKGFHVFILSYSVGQQVFPTALLELAESMRFIREELNHWSIDGNRIIVGGFSAGGHLAGCLATMWHDYLVEQYCYQADSIQPNGLLLGYPVITANPSYWHEKSFREVLGEQINDPQKILGLSLEKQVNEKVPKTFIWHTFEDELVHVNNTLFFTRELERYGIPFELHVYANGLHGMSLGTEETLRSDGSGRQKNISSWVELFNQWVDLNL